MLFRSTLANKMEVQNSYNMAMTRNQVRYLSGMDPMYTQEHRLRGLKCLDQHRGNLEQVAADAVVGDLEDRRGVVLAVSYTHLLVLVVRVRGIPLGEAERALVEKTDGAEAVLGKVEAALELLFELVGTCLLYTSTMRSCAAKSSAARFPSLLVG